MVIDVVGTAVVVVVGIVDVVVFVAGSGVVATYVDRKQIINGTNVR